jgi:parallel beta-helix repeat protein
MKAKFLLLTLALGLGFILVLLGWLTGQVYVVRAHPGIRYVTPDGDDGGLCDSIANRCRTVQRALDVADPFDEIRVTTGIYTDTAGTVATIDKTVTLLGGYDDSFTLRDPSTYRSVLDAKRYGRVVQISGNISPTLDGFVITGGNANDESRARGRGGGILSSGASPIIQNNVITNNIAYTGTSPWGHGGGIYLYQASASAVIRGNRVVSNTASTTYYGLGGGMSLSESAVKVSGNEISGNSAGRGGAGVYLHDSDGMTFEGNLVVGNTAVVSPTGDSYGGGLYFEFTDPFTLTNNVIAQNRVNTAGGGLYVYGSTDIWGSAGTLVNNTIAQNNLGGGGEGVFLAAYTTLTLTNNIIVSHTYGIYAHASCTATARYTLFYDNTSGDTGGYGSISSSYATTGHDPLFMNAAGWNYHLLAGSPAIDAADPAGVPPAPAVDMDGHKRPIGLRVDIGADEARFAIFLPVVLKNDAP